MDKDVVEVVFKKKLGECMAYQQKFGEKQAQLEFQAPKQVIKSATKKQQVKKTKEQVLDVFGFESSDRPHIEKWSNPDYRYIEDRPFAKCDVCGKTRRVNMRRAEGDVVVYICDKCKQKYDEGKKW